MTSPVTPYVDCEQLHTCLPVSDALAAADFYTKKLDFWQSFTWGDPPTVAGVKLANVQIFLHTCDQLGDAVHSPHTKRTLRYIRKLKKKHGIGYNSHASYRFVEEYTRRIDYPMLTNTFRYFSSCDPKKRDENETQSLKSH